MSSKYECEACEMADIDNIWFYTLSRCLREAVIVFFEEVLAGIIGLTGV